MVLKGEEFRGMNRDSVEVEWESKTASNLIVLLSWTTYERESQRENVQKYNALLKMR